MATDVAPGARRAVGGQRPAALVAAGRRLARIALAVGVFWGFAELGDVLARAAGVAVPGSVIGLLALWLALEAGVVRLRWIDDGASRLIGALGLLFVPAGAGFVQFVGAGTVWLEVGATVVVGALLTLAVSAHVVQRGVSDRD